MADKISRDVVDVFYAGAVDKSRKPDVTLLECRRIIKEKNQSQ